MSLNATKHGLFAARDFIRQGEEEEYAKTRASLIEELAPGNAVEELFATEIVGAAWRLRRCRILEQDFSSLTDLDPMMDEKTEKTQRSVDRARAQSHLILRRGIAELRTLQTERQIRIQLFPNGVPGEGLGVMDFRKAVQQTTAKPRTEVELRAMAKADVDAMVKAPSSPAGSSFCKPPVPFCTTPKDAPRNAPCPCGSALKYKRCCGNPANPVQNRAA